MELNLKKDIYKKRAEIVSLILSPLLGFLAFVLPVAMTKGVELEKNGSILILFINSIYENVLIIPTAILLFICGVILGAISRRFRWLNGIMTILIFPAVALYEMLVSPTSHNLWPLEFIICSLFSMPAILGSYIGNRIVRRRDT
jgi:hypothetical protein